MSADRDEPNHYEVLGVDREASAGTIRKAWRKRTDKSRPGSDEFRRLNAAAETLLDPRQRLAYDASLPEPDAPEPDPDPPEGVAATDANRPGGRRPLRTRSRVALTALALLTLAALVVAGIYTHQYRQDRAIDSARTQASNAATRALSVILSYDYRHMAQDKERAEPYLASSYAKEYAHNFDLLTEARGGKPGPVEQTKTVVTASVLGTGVMDAEADQVHVMAFVDQRTVHHAGPKSQRCSPSCVLTNRVAVTMVKQGDDWLVAGLEPK